MIIDHTIRYLPTEDIKFPDFLDQSTGDLKFPECSARSTEDIKFPEFLAPVHGGHKISGEFFGSVHGGHKISGVLDAVHGGHESPRIFGPRRT